MIRGEKALTPRRICFFLSSLRGTDMRRYAIQVAWPEQAETTVSKASQADNPIGQAAYLFAVLWQI